MPKQRDYTRYNAGSSTKPSWVADDQQSVVKNNEKEGFVRSDLAFYLKVAKATYHLKSRTINKYKRQRIGCNNISDLIFSCSRFFVLKAKESNEIVVAFRGSSKLKDLLLDIMFIPKAVGDRYVHSGVAKESHKLLQKRGLLKELERAIQLHPNSRVVFVGHSLGGGLASYLAWYITKQSPELTISVYTFGSLPCTSNPSITEGQNLSVFNFVNKLDPVPRASWERMSGAFRDDANRNRNRNGFRRPMHLFGKTVLLQDNIELGGFFDCFQKGAGLTDHWIPSYSKALENWFAADTQTEK